MNLSTTKNICNKRIFSGIQPSGIPHLGNYFGAISQWIGLTREVSRSPERLEQKQTPIFCIVDVHAYTSPSIKFGKSFYSNILSTTASLIALGLDINKCILFRQSDLFEHNFLDNVLRNFVNYGPLSRMIQFKEKTRDSKDESMTCGLLSYPVLQAADILLYKASLVPVGHDQVQHIELTRNIARKFNQVIEEEFFPLPQAYLNPSEHAHRLKSLRDPTKKMSKSDLNARAYVQVIDEPDVITEKCKKAITDCESAVYYDPELRPAVSNLMRIYHLATGQSLDDITREFDGVETAIFKLKLADALIERFGPARNEFKRIIKDRAFLEEILKFGAEKSRPIALDTIKGVKHHLGSYCCSDECK